MDYLLDYGLTKGDLIFIKSHYDNKILSNIIYKKNNIIKIIEELNKKEFDIKYLILNRLDIFFIDYEDFKNKFNRYTKEELELLKEDFSIFC